MLVLCCRCMQQIETPVTTHVLATNYDVMSPDFSPSTPTLVGSLSLDQ